MLKFNPFMASVGNQFVNSIGRSMFRFCVLAQPVINGFLMGMLYRNRSEMDFLLYGIAGSGIMTFWGSMAFSSAADIQREKWYGTMENIFACPAGFPTVILGKIVGNTVWGFMGFFLTALFSMLFFQRFPTIAHPLLFGGAFVLMSLSFVATAFLIAGIFTLSRRARVFMNFLEYPVYILCGVVFPLSLLPRALQLPSWLLTPRWSVELLRYTAGGSNPLEGMRALLMVITLTVLYSVAGGLSYRLIDRKARSEASLGVY